jgi:hypothetical protein
VTSTHVPRGRVRWAAVIARGSKLCPLAILRPANPGPYHVASPAWTVGAAPVERLADGGGPARDPSALAGALAGGRAQSTTAKLTHRITASQRRGDIRLEGTSLLERDGQGRNAKEQVGGRSKPYKLASTFFRGACWCTPTWWHIVHAGPDDRGPY